MEGFGYLKVSGADPGFLKGGFRSTKGGSFSMFNRIFLNFSHENEIIWFRWGGFT